MSAVLDFAIALTFRLAAVSPDPYRVVAARQDRGTYADLGQGELDGEIATRQITSSPPGRQADVDVAKRYQSLLDMRPDMVQGSHCVMNFQSYRPVT